MSSLSILITILFNSVSYSLLASISFSSFSRMSSIPFDSEFFLWLPILGNSFCLFLWFSMLCFSICLYKVSFCGSSSMGFRVAVSLISLSGFYRVALSSICVGSLLLEPYLLVDPLLVDSPVQQAYWYSHLPPCLVCGQGLGEGEME